MSLLPKSSEEFSSKEYWNDFFTKRGRNSFEWYGEFTELCGIFHKYIRPKDKILMSGCGNSALSAQMFRVGFRNITNVDVSEVVIKQMKEKHKLDCPEMVWLHGDMLNLVAINAESFTCILDKGTLDALMSSDSNEALLQAQKYFQELGRLLRVGGRYICISLLQEHILKSLVKWFPTHGWMMRFCRCEEAEKAQLDQGLFSLPVFAVVCTKFKQMPNFRPILELSMQENCLRRVESATDIEECITSLQQFAVTRHNLRNKTLSGEKTCIELCDAKTSQVRYSLYVVDNPKSNNKLHFAVFIVPQGRETEWLFASSSGQRQLAESSSTSRIIVVHMKRDQKYASMKEVQDELSAKVLELMPAKVPSKYKVPFLSVGEDLGQRIELHRGNSVYSGEFIVEDIKSTSCKYTLRRLIFLNNPNIIQSEAKLVREASPGGASKPLLVDRAYLSCSHHLVMAASLELVSYDSSVLLVGLGGGLLAAFIRKFFVKASIIAVDVDKAIVEVARKWFNFADDLKMGIVVDDGVHYINECHSQEKHFDIIMFDVDSKDRSQGLSCPPKLFVEVSFLQKVLDCLTNDGMFVLNLVCRDTSLRRSIVKDLKSVFSSVIKINIPEEVNCILFCQDISNPPDVPGHYKKKLNKYNQFLKQQQKVTDDVMEVDEFVRSVQVL